MKDYDAIRKHHRLLKAGKWIDNHTKWLRKAWHRLKHQFRFLAVFYPLLRTVGGFLRKSNPFQYVKIVDWYITKKFIGTYIFSIILIMAIAIVFDFNENLSKFTQHHAPMEAIIFDYYANFIPYYANLFSPLFIFIAVIFFTSKMAGNSEFIALISSGISFKRLLRPYLVVCVFLSAFSFLLSAYVIPKGQVVMQNFNVHYRSHTKYTSSDNVQLQVGKGVIAYMQHYDDKSKSGYGFSLDKFDGKNLVSHMTAAEIQYDTISDSKYHWTVENWKIRTRHGLREEIATGARKDTLIQMEPTDLVYSKGQQETFTSPELRDYISKQINRGSGNVILYQVEYHKRFASSFAAFILTIIGVSLASHKRKGGMGLYLGIGLVLSFVYIMMMTVSSTFAVNANTTPILAAWIPNIVFSIVAWFCYRKALN